MSTRPPHAPRLALLIEPPHIADTISELIAKYLARRVPHVLVACGEYDFVGRQGAAVGEV